MSKLNKLLFVFVLLPGLVFAPYKGGSYDGVSASGSFLQNPLPSIYTGGSNDGTASASTFNQNPLPPIYLGGINDGTALGAATKQNTLPQIYSRGVNDGTSLAFASNQNNIPQIYLGGLNDGSSISSNSSQNPLPEIFKGGMNDGVSSASSSAENPLPSIYLGGQDDGTAIAFSLNQNKSEALPISILEFSGSWFNDDAILGWEVGDQKNLEHFELERSIDEGKNFSKIATIQPEFSNLYRYTDVRAYDLPPDFLLYRLKSIDKADGFKYSAIVRLDKDKTIPSIVVYPNPTGGRFTLALMNVKVPNEYSYGLITSDGKLIKQGLLTLEKTEFTLSGYANGSYHLSLYHKDQLIQQFTIILSQ
ncbi:MAG: T9SS type A sorting domain-containing protein [Chitinophagaceae bacterium]